jgi:hypothetical protein
VALNYAVDLGNKPSRGVVFIWYERLAALYTEATPASEFLTKAIKWATGATSDIFGSDEDNDHPALDKNQ